MKIAQEKKGECSMNKETLERAIEIKKNLEALDKLWHIMCIPHPQICDGTELICLIAVGEEAEKDIKETIQELIKRNKDLLENELEAL